MSDSGAKFVQLRLSDAQRGLSLVAAYLKPTPADLKTKVGIEFEITNGDLGQMEAALFSRLDGKTFGLFRYLDSPRTDYTALVIREDTRDLSADVNDALGALSLKSSDVISFHPDFKFERCEIWRQDDHGNKSIYGDFACRADAEFAIGVLSQQNDKQSYWIERAA